ncbi:MAG TPA: hypothetical protein VMN39_01040, partial [Longimicrobiaceae bacterium]|nr:hypothetical protein [Longimicrobiaceae bacterium]
MKRTADLIKDATDAFNAMSAETWDKGKPMPAPLAKASEKMLDVLKALQGQSGGAPVIVPGGGNSWSGGGGDWDRAGKSPGHAFAESSALESYMKAGIPRGSSSKAAVPSFLEQKAVPTIGSGSIQAARDSTVRYDVGLDRLRLIDVIPKVPTTSNSVEYLKVTSAQPTIAAGVAEGATKPEATIAVEVASAAVRVIAAWMPVTEQQLSDLPQIRQL